VRLDEFIRIEKFKAQLLRDEPAHGCFARAHETYERKVDELAAALHGAWISGKSPRTHASISTSRQF
jgi:hypothetical protein